jgi:AcrR family transcriptional regulator
MARTIDEEAHAIKRDQILEAAFRLIAENGYECMSIQDLLGALGISKGNLYHYFSSKKAILDALLERMLAELEELVEPVAKDPDSTAATAIKRFFAALAKHKASQKPFVSGVLRGWYRDDNAIVREKIRAALCVRLAPLLAMIIRRGCERHELKVSEPDHAARIVLALTQDLSDTLARSIVFEDRAAMTSWVPQAVASTTEAIERLLCASPGSVSITELDAIKTWFATEGAKHEI